jgi:ribosomal protein S18 acetylase RimI-like enzyme
LCLPAACLFNRKMGVFSMLIRRYQASDNKEVKELHYAGVAQIDPDPHRPDNPFVDNDLDDIEGIYLNDRGDFIMGTIENEIVAMGALQKVSADLGEIKRIRVRRDYQKQGYGGKILAKLISRARELGYTELCLDTLADNTPARRLFEKGGFIKKNHGKIGSYDLIFYRKKLDKGGK